MKIEEKNLSELSPYEFNNRTHPEEQINRIADSIKEFGFNQPIVIDENNIILVGHGRFLAAHKLGLVTVPVVQLTQLDEVKKKAYRVLDNKLQTDSSWQFDNLGLELGFLEDNGFELEKWGLEDLMPNSMIKVEDSSEEESEEEPKLITCPSCNHVFCK